MLSLEDRLREVSINNLLRALYSDKDYVVVDMLVTNAGVNYNVICTNDYNKYKNISDDGYSFIFPKFEHETNIIIKILISKYEEHIQLFTIKQRDYTFDDYLKKVIKISPYNFNRLRIIYNKYKNKTKIYF